MWAAFIDLRTMRGGYSTQSKNLFTHSQQKCSNISARFVVMSDVSKKSRSCGAVLDSAVLI